MRHPGCSLDHSTATSTKSIYNCLIWYPENFQREASFANPTLRTSTDLRRENLGGAAIWEPVMHTGESFA
jgi:hypothetical protein